MKKSPTDSHTHKRKRGNYRGKDNQLRIKSDIFSLSDNHTDQEIMDILKIENGTYYRYKNMLYQEAKEIWKQTYNESMESRILHTINSINLAIKTSKEIVKDTTQHAKDRLEAASYLVEVELSFIELLRSLRNDNAVVVQEENQRTKPDFPVITDPKWIEENAKRVMRESNLKKVK